MDKFLQRIADNPVMVAVLAVAFTISMLLFWRRVRHERDEQRRHEDENKE
jgi:hypothetical protein